MSFKVDEIVYYPEDGSLGVVFQGEPTEHEAQIVSDMMEAFAELIGQHQENAQNFMMLMMCQEGEVH
jgi:hypothetical protein